MVLLLCFQLLLLLEVEEEQALEEQVMRADQDQVAEVKTLEQVVQVTHHP
jgi:hypothetical protein